MPRTNKKLLIILLLCISIMIGLYSRTKSINIAALSATTSRPEIVEMDKSDQLATTNILLKEKKKPQRNRMLSALSQSKKTDEVEMDWSYQNNLIVEKNKLEITRSLAALSQSMKTDEVEMDWSYQNNLIAEKNKQEMNTSLAIHSQSMETNKVEKKIKVSEELMSAVYNTTNPYKEAQYVETSKYIFVLGASAHNTTDRQSWSEFVVYGQMNRRKIPKSDDLSCCFRYGNGAVINKSVIRNHKHWSRNSADLSFLYVACPNPLQNYEHSTTLPVDIAVISKYFKCDNKSLKYIKPYYPWRQKKGSFAVTTKVSHGDVTPNLIINWMEAYRWLGVTKVITFAYPNLNADARKVLEFYARTGFLDLYTHELSDIEHYPRQIHIQTPQIWTDLSITLQHSFEVSRGYNYFSVIDWDEFIIPDGDRRLLDIASNLGQHRGVAAIRFKSQFYLAFDGDQSETIFLKQHRKKSIDIPKFDRPKLIYRPNDISMAFSQKVVPKDTRMTVYDYPEYKVVLRHFRRCIPTSHDASECLTDYPTVIDNTISEWVDRHIAYDVLNITSLLKQELSINI